MKRLVSVMVAVLALGPPAVANAEDVNEVDVMFLGLPENAVVRGEQRLTVRAVAEGLRSVSLSLERSGTSPVEVMRHVLPATPPAVALDVVLDWSSPRMPNGRYALVAHGLTYEPQSGTGETTVVVDNAAPAVQEATVTVGADGVPTLRWCPVSVPDLLGYDVERQVDGGGYVPLARVPGTEYADAAAPVGEVSYRVAPVRESAMDPAGRRSAWQETAAVTVTPEHATADGAAPECGSPEPESGPAVRRVSVTPTFVLVQGGVKGVRVDAKITRVPRAAASAAARPAPTASVPNAGTGRPTVEPAPPAPAEPAHAIVPAQAEGEAAGRGPLVPVALVLAGAVVAGLVARLRRRGPPGAAAAPPPIEATPIEATPAAPPPRRIVKRLLLGGPKQAGAAAALVMGVSGAFFVVWPNLKPSTENAVDVTNVAVEPDVSLLAYARHPAVVGALDRAGGLAEFIATNCEALGRVGTVVHVDYEVKGYAEHSISVRWSLIDGKTGHRLMESEGNDPLPLSFVAGKRDTDIGSWEMWVPAAPGATSLKARIELYDTAARTRLAFKDSPGFAPPSRADRATGPC